LVMRDVGQLELKPVLSLSPATLVSDACRQMADKNVDSVLIVDTAGDGSKPDALLKPRLVGIVTVKDVCHKVIGKGLEPSTTKLEKVMTFPVHSLPSNTSLYKILSLMDEKDFRQVPVVDDGDILGIATSQMINTCLFNDIIKDLKVLVSIFK